VAQLGHTVVDHMLDHTRVLGHMAAGTVVVAQLVWFLAAMVASEACADTVGTAPVPAPLLGPWEAWGRCALAQAPLLGPWEAWEVAVPEVPAHRCALAQALLLEPWEAWGVTVLEEAQVPAWRCALALAPLLGPWEALGATVPEVCMAQQELCHQHVAAVPVGQTHSGRFMLECPLSSCVDRAPAVRVVSLSLSLSLSLDMSSSPLWS